MCLTIDNKYHPKDKPLITNKNIYTLKVVKSSDKTSCISYYKNHHQNFNKLLRVKLISKWGWSSLIINNGLHSLIKSYKNSFNNDIFDSYAFDSIEVILCKIPKGSKYYIGIEQDIVSNQLVNLEVLVANNKSSIKLDARYRLNSINGAVRKAYQICESYGIKIGI